MPREFQTDTPATTDTPRLSRREFNQLAASGLTGLLLTPTKLPFVEQPKQPQSTEYVNNSGLSPEVVSETLRGTKTILEASRFPIKKVTVRDSSEVSFTAKPNGESEIYIGGLDEKNTRERVAKAVITLAYPPYGVLDDLLLPSSLKQVRMMQGNADFQLKTSYSKTGSMDSPDADRKMFEGSGKIGGQFKPIFLDELGLSKYQNLGIPRAEIIKAASRARTSLTKSAVLSLKDGVGYDQGEFVTDHALGQQVVFTLLRDGVKNFTSNDDRVHQLSREANQALTTSLGAAWGEIGYWAMLHPKAAEKFYPFHYEAIDFIMRTISKRPLFELAYKARRITIREELDYIALMQRNRTNRPDDLFDILSEIYSERIHGQSPDILALRERLIAKTASFPMWQRRDILAGFDLAVDSPVDLARTVKENLPKGTAKML